MDVGEEGRNTFVWRGETTLGFVKAARARTS